MPHQRTDIHGITRSHECDESESASVSEFTRDPAGTLQRATERDDGLAITDAKGRVVGVLSSPTDGPAESAELAECREELARSKAFVHVTVGPLLRMVDELAVQFNAERQAYNAIGGERDELRAKLTEAESELRIAEDSLKRWTGYAATLDLRLAEATTELEWRRKL